MRDARSSPQLYRENKLAFATGAPEAADAKIKKNYNDHRRCKKRPMIGALLPACPCAPEDWAEDQNGEQEEDAGNLEPDFAADAAEGLEKAAESAGYSAGSLACDAATIGGISGRSARLGV